MSNDNRERGLIRRLKAVDDGYLLEFDDELMSLFDDPPTIREGTLAEISFTPGGFNVRILPELLPPAST